MTAKANGRAADGPEVVEEINTFLQRYVVMSDAQALVCTLWMVHTYLFPKYQGSTGYLHISSPVPECGKSQLLEVTELFVANPVTIGGATAAALIRTIDRESPTLLFDEADLNMHDKEMSALLCSVFNNGWRPNRPYIKCDGEKHGVRKFHVFGPKALAGIGMHYMQPATLTRCFPIRLQRHGASRMAEEYYIDAGEEESLPIRHRLKGWTDLRKPVWLANKRPVGIPRWLNSRKKSISFPLFAIADDLSGGYSERLGAALEEIFIGKSGKMRLDYKIQLLLDVRMVFDDLGRDVLETSDLLNGLHAIETSPWSEASNGKPLTPHKLALLLSDFGPEPKQCWVAGRNVRAYGREDFHATWDRYLPPGSITPPSESLGSLDPAVYGGQTNFSKVLEQGAPITLKNAVSLNVYACPNDPSALGEGVGAGEGEKQKEFRCEGCGHCFDTSAGYARHKVYGCVA